MFRSEKPEYGLQFYIGIGSRMRIEDEDEDEDDEGGGGKGGGGGPAGCTVSRSSSGGLRGLLYTLPCSQHRTSSSAQC
ncbi:hypothetical protein M0802_007622 [Mischocyttarus mexicanus]|nr:hypothetical protein M0802_007622 [Mischocyttarus mexicanus]